MRVLVTGGAGFIGSHVNDRLISDGHQVVVVDDLSAGNRENVPPQALFVHGDILRSGTWLHQVGDVDAIIHLAAQISVPASEHQPIEDVRQNVLGVVMMLEVAQKLGVREFRLASSAAVYGDDPEIPLQEDRVSQPLSYYGLDKWVAEHYVRHQERMKGLKGTILRIGNAYGPRQRTEGEGGVVAVFSDMLANAQTPLIHGDGEQTRDFISVFDIARAFTHRLGEPGAGGTYNIATEEATTVLELWRLLAGTAGVDSSSVQHGPERPGDIRHSLLSVTRAREWGFQAAMPLAEGLALTYRYFKEIRRC